MLNAVEYFSKYSPEICEREKMDEIMAVLDKHFEDILAYNFKIDKEWLLVLSKNATSAYGASTQPQWYHVVVANNSMSSSPENHIKVTNMGCSYLIELIVTILEGCGFETKIEGDSNIYIKNMHYKPKYKNDENNTMDVEMCNEKI